MSHLTTMNVSITDLGALADAADDLGMVMERASSFKWYGRHVGDYPLPAGFTVDDLGQCEYRLKLKPDHPNLRPGLAPYEVGVCRRRDGKPGYVLLWDFWNGGYGLRDTVGEDGNRLRQGYSAAVTRRTLTAQGFMVREKTQADGRIVMQAVRA